jgi:putative toxin-antitoxin system antitoxin component (TIGR02293 family)
MCGEERENI